MVLLFCGTAFCSNPVFGDLDKDGVLDKAQIDGTVITVTFTKKVIRAKKAIFDGYPTYLSIKKNVLFITYEGGARDKWTEVFKWRLDASKRDFVLIGSTYEVEDTVGKDPKETVDINYVTGRVNRVIGKTKRYCSFKAKKVYLTKFNLVDQKDDLLAEAHNACFIKDE